MLQSPAGEHAVRFGSTFASAGTSPFVSVRYSAKPSSLDPAKAGTISAAPAGGQVQASFPAVDDKPDQWFAGTLTQARELECVLVWDEHEQTYVLERLDSTLKLAHDRSARGSQHAHPTPAPASTIAGADDSSSSDEIFVPSVPPKHLRKPASDRARALLGQSGGTSSSTSGDERGRPALPRARPAEVEDFGDIPLIVPAPAPGRKGKAPAPRYEAPVATPYAFPVPAAAPPARALALPTPAAPRPPTPKPTPAPPKPPTPARVVAPPPVPRPSPAAASKRPAPPPPVPQPKAAASKRLPAPARASKKPAAPPPPAASTSTRPRRSSVALKSMPASVAARPASSGSDESGSEDDSSDDEEDDDEESGPEGYLAVPGSVLSRTARAPAVDDDDDESESEVEMEELESAINAGLGKRPAAASKGVPSRPAAASKMPARPRVASKGPAAQGRVAAKGPASAGRVASKGPARTQGGGKGKNQGAMSLSRMMDDPQRKREMDDDVPDSSEED